MCITILYVPKFPLIVLLGIVNSQMSITMFPLIVLLGIVNSHNYGVKITFKFITKPLKSRNIYDEFSLMKFFGILTLVENFEIKS